MGIVLIDRILSVSSEDPAFPAENLLKSDSNRKWKCKHGEKQASVILQLQQDTEIDGIDIGNENSAFVEILVGKSSLLGNDFKVLLVASSLMTLKDAKDGINSNGVRFFKKSDLTKPTADNKWDRIKIVCTQPFNKHVQYGLSFLVLHSSSGQGTGDSSSSSLGRFTLKGEEKDKPVAVGSWFAKRKDPPLPVPPGAAAAIRDASSPANIAQSKKRKPTPRRPKHIAPKSEDEDSPADDTDADSTYSPTKDSASVLSDDNFTPDEVDEDKEIKKPKRSKKGRDANNGNILNGQTSKLKTTEPISTKRNVAKVKRQTKPFGRLLEGVTVVISGYQNPLRGELRTKACAMGAKYKVDWDNFCTHLICAFVNTPKFNQVQGRGKIVKKDWVEECHNHRRRLPWRRFALDRNDTGTSSEEEIWEEVSIPSTSNIIPATRSGVNQPSGSSGSDTEEEIERVRARQAAKNTITPSNENQKVNNIKKLNSKTKDNAGDSFASDTDVDSDTESQTAKLPLPHLANFFENIVFHIASDVDDQERKNLHRYITAYKGCVVDEMDGSVEYVLTRQADIAAEVLEEFGIGGVSPDWVWECSNEQKLISTTEFLL